MELRYPKNTRLILLAMLGSIFASFSYIIFTYNPLDFLIQKVIAFYPDSIVFNLWKEPPYEIKVRGYIFNVTNSQEFLDGNAKLKFNEVGPYVYKEILYNENPQFNDNGTITFTPRRRIAFVPEESIGNPATDTILSPNIPLLGITAALKEDSMFINLAVASLSRYLGSQPFLNLTIDQYLYGYPDPLISLANDYIPNWIDFAQFGVLDRLMALDNGSNIVTMNVDPYIKTSQNPLLTEKERLQPFSIQRWNGSPGLRQWGYQDSEGNETSPENTKCNLVEGSYIGTMFPRNIEENATFTLYRHAFCRGIPIVYEGRGYTKDGLEGYNYRVKQNFLDRSDENPDNECFCSGDNCPEAGLSDLSPCYYNIPITLSQPHFLNAAPSLLEQVEGLKPDKEKHDFTITIHPKIGLPLEAKIRVQINLRIPTTTYNYKVEPFNNLVLPLFWVELSIDSIPANVKFYIQLLYHILPLVQEIIMFVSLTVGILMIFGSALALVLSTDEEGRRLTRMNVKYSEIPVFQLKGNMLKPDVLIEK